MNYFFNDRNLLSDAVVSALNVVSSSAIYRTDDDAKTGSGIVSLTGPYTGQHDSTFDVEILDGTGDSSQVSQPVFTGVGNGTMSDVSVTDLDAQVFTIRLVDPGTQTLTATAVFQGVTLKAAASGDDGNDLSISVDTSAIVRTPKGAALLEDLRAGTNAYTGSQWDFGAKALVNGGTDIPDDAPRIAFGIDPQVYRAYKVFDASAGQYVYSFSPPPVRDVEAGSQVYDVTGAYDISVTDGSTTEDYPSCTTLYDLMTALSASSFIDPDSAIAYNDHKPNGQAISDISVLTQSHVLSIEKDGSRAVFQADIGITVAEAAPQERLSIRCTSNSVVGGEVWEVSGDVSGTHDNATTGEVYSDGTYAFTIPVQLPPPGSPEGDILPTLLLNPRGEGEQVPTMCVDQALLGARATNGTFTFVYKRRPPPDCDCSTGELLGGPNADCLGLEPEGGDDVTEDRRLLRLQKLAAAVQILVSSNTAPSSDVAVVDVPWIEDTAAILAKGLNDAAAGPKVNYPVWSSKTYGIDEQVEPTVSNGFRYVVTTPGAAGATEPATWTTTIGGTVTDGDVVWTNAGKTALELWDEYFDAWNDEMSILSGIGAASALRTWSANKATSYFSTGTVNGYWGCKPTTPNGIAMALFGGTLTDTTGASEPTWPSTVGIIVFDGDVEWKAIKQYWIAEHTYATNAIMNPYAGQIFKATVGGTSGSEEPDWTAGGSVTDGDITWTPITSADLPSSANTNRDIYFERFRSQMSEVTSVAGVAPNFSSASANGDGCWQDHESDYWFESQDGLLPMFVGYPYHSARLVTDDDGKLVVRSTQQFYLGLRWGCPDKLQEGDAVKVVIDGATGLATTYQVDDTFSISIAHADPVPFGGGQPGDDTLTWSVSGSLDGPFADYALVTTALAAYSDGGLAFTITPGGIPFQLGDTFTFAAVGGHFQWRQNGGSWSSSTVIGTTTLADGVSANFTGGASDPSWAAGDTFSFEALAINGADQATSPTDGRLTWTGSTTIAITPTSSSPVSRLALFDHTIPSDAAIRLQGSDDNFATTPTDIAITWTARHVLAVFDAVTRAKWRITIDKGGSIFWAFLGAQMQPMNPRGIRDVGIFTKRRRVPGLGVRSALAGEIKHEVVSQTSFEDFMDGLDYACANDDGTFGVVINEGLSEMMLVRFTGTEVEVTDLLDYQPLDAVKNRVQAFTLPVAALP